MEQLTEIINYISTSLADIKRVASLNSRFNKIGYEKLIDRMRGDSPEEVLFKLHAHQALNAFDDVLCKIYRTNLSGAIADAEMELCFAKCALELYKEQKE